MDMRKKRTKVVAPLNNTMLIRSMTCTDQVQMVNHELLSIDDYCYQVMEDSHWVTDQGL